MWNFSYVIPSILILFILLFYYFSLRRLPIRMNRGFVGLLFAETLVVLSDVLSTYADINYRELPYYLVVYLNAQYFVAFVIRSKMFDTITCINFAVNPFDNRFIAFLKDVPLIISEIFILSTPWTKAIFSIEETGYVKGDYYNIIYVPYFWYLMLAVIYIYKYKYRIKRKRNLICVVVYNDLVAIGLAFRICYPKILIFDTFCVMSILIINLVFMNPEFYLDKRTNLFNSDALRAMLSEPHSLKNCYLIGFIIKNYNEAREIYGANQMDEGISLVGEYLQSSFVDVKQFYYRSGRFVITGRDQQRLIDIKRQIEDRFRNPWQSNEVDMYLDIGFVVGAVDLRDYDAEISITSIVTSLRKIGSNPGKFEIELNESVIEETKQLIYIKRCLEDALDNNKTEVFLQPIVTAKERKVVGAEALCRIRDKEGNIIPPGKFIPIAERNGHINMLGEQIFEKTCQFIRNNNLSMYGVDWINVNVSTIQFMQHNLADRFEEILLQNHLNPRMIHLELTEAAMVDEVLMERQIRNLQKKGFYLVVDDYGTGYSNISRLKKYPFINVKLDMSLVWDYVKKPGVIVPKMVEAFNDTGYTVTAEGIETEEIAEVMERCGCDYLQGMYFSKPIPENEFMEYLKNQ